MQFDHNPVTSTTTTFLKINDGESVQGVFRGDPHAFKSKWTDSGSELCQDNDPEGRFRFRINFVQMVNGALTAFIWEQGARVYDNLKVLNADYDLESTIVRITRSGTGTDTRYTIIPIKKHQVDGDLEKSLKEINLHRLEHELRDL